MPTSPSTSERAQAGAAHEQTEHVIIGVDPHKLSATIEVVDEHEQLLGLGSVHHRPGRLRRDAQVREGLAGAGLGGRGQQRRRPAARAATPRGRRTGRRRPGEARRPGPAVRHRPQPQDRRPRRALDRGRRGPHQDPAGAAARRRARGAADAHRPPRSTHPAPGPDRRPAPGAARRTPSWAGETRHHHRPGQGDARHRSARATSPARPAAASPPRSWPSWSRSRPRSRRPPPSSRPSCSPAAHT